MGTRPNFIKITQLEKHFKNHPNVDYYLLHTGQHHDSAMNEVFFNQLQIKKPDFQFVLEPGSQISVITQIMNNMEKICTELQPNLVVVPGDVNSSLACALVANRLGIPVAHIESGLRSFDMSMPEEVNRILIDKISDLYFITEDSGMENLIKEGHQPASMHFVGNSMIDTLIESTAMIDQSAILNQLQVSKKKYILFTFHRPVNVDNKEHLSKLMALIEELSAKYTCIFPVHPRTKNNIAKWAVGENFNSNKNILLCNPLGYFDFLKLIKHASIVITDSGGIQEETTFLQVPCLTIRPNTERPVTITEGTNQLLDLDVNLIIQKVGEIESNTKTTTKSPKYWDGKTSERIVEAIAQYLSAINN